MGLFRKKILLRFGHGLGDAAQLTGMIESLKSQRRVVVDVASMLGKHSLFHGVAENTYVLGQEPSTGYDEVYTLSWDECGQVYPGYPSTKLNKCLKEVFGCDLVRTGYSIHVRQERLDEIVGYLGEIPKPYVCFHYRGNTSAQQKDITEGDAAKIIDLLRDAGYTTLLFDWDKRSTHLNREGVFVFDIEHPIWMKYGTGDGETIKAIVDHSHGFIGIDSGPLHVAMASSVPKIGLWTKHHPLHYADKSPNMIHLVPRDHRKYIRGNRDEGVRTFEEHYRFQTYRCLAESVETIVLKWQQGEQDYLKKLSRPDFYIRSQYGEQDLVIFNDVYRNDTYRCRILGIPHRSGRQIVVDVGAHIGTFTRLWKEINPDSIIYCIEVCPENIEALNKNVSEYAKVFHAACSYSREELVLLNTVLPSKTTTGGSIVIPRSMARASYSDEYVLDERPIKTIRLEDIATQIDILKLDCEGAEFEILENTKIIDRIGLIVGEYHDYDRWMRLVNDRFSNWAYSHIQHDNTGTFHLRNPHWKGCWSLG